MNFKNVQNIIGAILITVAAVSSSALCARGSIAVYNNSYYKVKLLMTTQSLAQVKDNKYSYTEAYLDAAPKNQDGTLQLHAPDANYPVGSNVPIGTVANVPFADTAKDFYIQIFDAIGRSIMYINVGSTLGTVVDNDPNRAIYIYSNVNAAGVSIPNVGGSVFYWDSAHPLDKPAIQYFPAAAA